MEVAQLEGAQIQTQPIECDERARSDVAHPACAMHTSQSVIRDSSSRQLQRLSVGKKLIFTYQLSATNMAIRILKL